MTLIGILLALACERALGHLPGIGEPMLFRRYVLALRRLLPWRELWRSWGAPLIVVAPPVAAAAWVQYMLENPFAHLGFSTLVLFLCLGPRDLSDDIARLLQARAAGDAQTVRRLSRVLMRSAEPESSRGDLIGALFVQSHERLFGVLLWFFAFGAAGAVAYRITSRLPRLLHALEPDDSEAERAASGLHTVLAWAPARCTAALYGLAGSMDNALQEWRRLREAGPEHWRSHTWAVLAEVSSGSLAVDEPHSGPAAPASLDDCLREVGALQTRALLILLAAFAFFTAGGLA